MTEHQKKFLLDTFFKNERYPGWIGIATDLLEKGECLVSGEECIWQGGIGNFIKVIDPPPAYFHGGGCVLYQFDRTFFDSEWCQEAARNYLLILEKKKAELEQELQAIKAGAVEIMEIVNNTQTK